jgi:hypothetical protein
MNSHCNNRQCRGLSLDDSEGGDGLSFLYRDFLDSITDVCGAIPSSSFDTSEEMHQKKLSFRGI